MDPIAELPPIPPVDQILPPVDPIVDVPPVPPVDQILPPIDPVAELPGAPITQVPPVPPVDQILPAVGPTVPTPPIAEPTDTPTNGSVTVSPQAEAAPSAAASSPPAATPTAAAVTPPRPSARPAAAVVSRPAAAPAIPVGTGVGPWPARALLSRPCVHELLPALITALARRSGSPPQPAARRRRHPSPCRSPGPPGGAIGAAWHLHFRTLLHRLCHAPGDVQRGVRAVSRRLDAVPASWRPMPFLSLSSDPASPLRGFAVPSPDALRRP